MGATATEQLTRRERQVAVLVAYGHTNSEIADLLSLSLRTVEMHRSAAMRKLAVRSRAGVVRWAIDQRLFA